jgi:hypothetical protein
VSAITKVTSGWCKLALVAAQSGSAAPRRLTVKGLEHGIRRESLAGSSSVTFFLLGVRLRFGSSTANVFSQVLPVLPLPLAHVHHKECHLLRRYH